METEANAEIDTSVTYAGSKLAGQVLDWMVKKGLRVDAHGNFQWIENGQIAKEVGGASGLLTDFAFETGVFERKGEKPSKHALHHAVMGLIRRESMARRRELIRNVTGKPSTDAGRAELRRMLDICRFEIGELDWLMLLHWMWTVKRSLVDSDDIPNPVCLVLYGPKQGEGKSAFIKHLCTGALFELHNKKVGKDFIGDGRQASSLWRYATACWDEMEGMGSACVERLKGVITGDEQDHRALYTNGSHAEPIRVRLIGTSNKPLQTIAQDTTGMRRFWQIDCLHRMSEEGYRELMSTDAELAWDAVSELEPDPLKGRQGEIRTAQESLVPEDVVSAWLQWEEHENHWGAIEGFGIDPIDPHSRGYGYTDLAARFNVWRGITGHQNSGYSAQNFGRRLVELGMVKRTANGRAVYRWPDS